MDGQGQRTGWQRDEDRVKAYNEARANIAGTGRTYQRHTPAQIEELENFFNINQRPNEDERSALGAKISLESRQVKFWFQNRRTTMKEKRGRKETTHLRQNYKKDCEKEIIMLKEYPSLAKCNGSRIPPNDEENLIMEIDQYPLIQELNNGGSTAVVERRTLTISTDEMSNSPNSLGHDQYYNQHILPQTPTSSLLPPMPMPISMPTITESLPKIVNQNYNEYFPNNNISFPELAQNAMEELVKLVSLNNPLWISDAEILELGSEEEVIQEYLSFEEYFKLGTTCCLQLQSPTHFSTRYATRASGIVAATRSSILHSFMDHKQWADLFPTIVGNSETIEIIEAGGNNGITLQMMQAELQTLSPLVTVRRANFLRFCKQISMDVWGVVDVSVDPSHSHNVAGSSISSGTGSGVFNCRRFPSGFLVKDLPDVGGSKIVWVEHLEFEDDNMHPMVAGSNSGFGAQRWLASLQRQCQCLAVISSPPSVITLHDQFWGWNDRKSCKKSMVNLAHRMVRSFGQGICSTVHPWYLVLQPEAETGDDDTNTNTTTMLSARNNMDNPMEPIGVVLSAVSSVRMPVSHKRLFDFLKTRQLMGEWDEFNYTGPMQELVRVDKTNSSNSSVSLIRATVLDGNMKENGVLIVQETQSDESGSMIVHSVGSVMEMQMLFNGGDPSTVVISPTGFTLAPYTKWSEGDEESCLMTVAFQTLTKNSPGNTIVSLETIQNVNNIMRRRIHTIKSALLPSA